MIKWLKRTHWVIFEENTAKLHQFRTHHIQLMQMFELSKSKGFIFFFQCMGAIPGQKLDQPNDRL